MKKNSYVTASIFIFISAVLEIVTYWDVAFGPHLVDSIVTIFSGVCLAGLGFITLKQNPWMKWILLLIMMFKFLNLVEVLRFQSELTLILTIIQFIILFSAMMLLFSFKGRDEKAYPV